MIVHKVAWIRADFSCGHKVSLRLGGILENDVFASVLPEDLSTDATASLAGALWPGSTQLTFKLI
jgi:hypothetical protein